MMKAKAISYLIFSTCLLTAANSAFAADESSYAPNPAEAKYMPRLAAADDTTTLPNPFAAPTTSVTKATPVSTNEPMPATTPSSVKVIAPAKVTTTTTTTTTKTNVATPVVANPNGITSDDVIVKKSKVLELEPAAATDKTPVDITKVAKLEPVNGKISFSFQNVPVKTLLQLIAKNSGLNFIISDDVKGNTTLSLKDVTWKEAFDIILKSHGLGSREIGNAIYVSTGEEIAAQQAKELQAAQDLANLAPLTTEVIALRYSNADDIAKVLKSNGSTMLTPRGEVSVNAPTNTIVVRDVKSNLLDVRKYIRELDIPTRQVSIEARIVNIDTTYEAQLGVRFGVSNTTSLSGTLGGANQLAGGVNVSGINPIDQRLNFDLPASLLSTGTTPASIGLALARLGPVLLDLELSALEEEGHSQIISKPRVVTANQQKARIETGEEIPYQQATSSGATSVEFKKAVLSLEILPQITPDDKIILKIKATQDTRGPQLLVAQSTTSTSSSSSSGTSGGSSGATTSTPAVFGPPTIRTQEVESYVVLSDNETVALGGIFTLTKNNTLDRVPFFSALPLIGGLFKHRSISNSRNELLIFLTPRIIREKSHEYAYKGD